MHAARLCGMRKSLCFRKVNPAFFDPFHGAAAILTAFHTVLLAIGLQEKMFRRSA
jgi:hypothetical protein